nr:hypothetical protein CFP56_57725 [Quercus suber]
MGHRLLLLLAYSTSWVHWHLSSAEVYSGREYIKACPPSKVPNLGRLTKEHIQAVCKVVTNSCEDARQSIRRARQKVDELTKKFVKSADDMCKAKEKEITGG